MRLADDLVTVKIGSERFRLRPTLRAAVCLERLYEGGFTALYNRIVQGHLGTLAIVVAETSTKPTDLEAVYDALEGQPLGTFLDSLKLAALDLLAKLTGHDGDSQTPQPSKGTPIPFAKFYAELYRIGAGSLGWTPDQVWSATPLEILEASRGRSDLLRAIFGGEAPQDESQPSPDMHGELDRVGLNRLRGKGRLR